MTTPAPATFVNLSDTLVLESLTGHDARFHAWLELINRAFHSRTVLTAQEIETRRQRNPDHRRTGVFEAGEPVATFRTWDTTLTLPGGQITADAVSSVTVAPTHRRRGLLSAMMNADLQRAYEQGTAAAVLIASEAAIYGRFGFGAATFASTWEVDLGRARIRPEVPSSGTTRLIAPEALRTLAPQIHQLSRRPGAIDVLESTWDDSLGLNPTSDDAKRLRTAVLHRSDEGTPDGFAVYRVDDQWAGRESRSVAIVQDLWCANPDAEIALWRFLTSLDLVASVKAPDRSTDELLPHLLTNPRAASKTSTADFLWTRILDPAAALSARTYERADRIIFAVDDDHGWASGRYLLQSDETGRGRCELLTRPDGRLAGSDQPSSDQPSSDQPSSDQLSPELTLPISTLSSLWLGSSVPHRLLDASQAIEHTPGAWNRLTRLLRTSREPAAHTWF